MTYGFFNTIPRLSLAGRQWQQLSAILGRVVLLLGTEMREPVWNPVEPESEEVDHRGLIHQLGFVLFDFPRLPPRSQAVPRDIKQNKQKQISEYTI